MRCDHGVPVPEEMSRDELIVLAAAQADRLRRQEARLARQDAQIAGMTTQIAELVEANEAVTAKPARLEHLLARNSRNSSSPPSRDDDPGRTPLPDPPTRRGVAGPGAGGASSRGRRGANLAWTDTPDKRTDRFPEGRCECGHDLVLAATLGEDEDVV
jgi:transposase